MRAGLCVLLLFCCRLYADPARGIYCRGEVNFSQGSFNGKHTVILSATKSGNWFLTIDNLILPAGRNLSHDPQRLYLNTLEFMRSEGVRAVYEWSHHRLTFRYRYNAGALGGGRRGTGATFDDCQEFTDHVPDAVDRLCNRYLN